MKSMRAIPFYAWQVMFLIANVAAAADKPVEIAGSLAYPKSVCCGPNDALYVTEMGQDGKDGDGKITMIKNGKAQPFATGLDDPQGIVFGRDAFFVTDKTKVVKVDLKGNKSVFAAADAFPRPPKFLHDIALNVANGVMLVSDSGDLKTGEGAVYRIDIRLNKIELIASAHNVPKLQTPNSVVFDGESAALVADSGAGTIYRVRFADGLAEEVATGIDGASGLTWDHFGRLFVISGKTGKVFGIPRPGKKPILIGEGLQSAADSCLSPDGRKLLIPDTKAGTLTELSTVIPGWEVDESPAPAKLERAFAGLKWTGWNDGSESGKVIPFRPIVLTHANDGSQRNFVATQQGVIHVFQNNASAQETKVFLDISDRVRYSDKQIEEGLLGLAFHPKYKQNGEFFVFYTDVKAKSANVVSRFRVKSNDKDSADPASEEELIRFEKPYGNHNGGCLVFGNDGYLYISLGDGGSGGDPHENGQNLKTLLGKILRIDVDRKAGGQQYAIPADNPFAMNAAARPEIFAYGLRNVWRMALDRTTGQLWAGDVGQNLFEEINLIKSGGNYGWSLRESLHPFGRKGVDVRGDLIEPIWEYDHDIGRSITGGAVYRGKQIPELYGAYLYSDYVSGRLWALRYDAHQNRVTGNHPIDARGFATMSFGEDEQGEIYLLRADPRADAIYRIVKSTTH